MSGGDILPTHHTTPLVTLLYLFHKCVVYSIIDKKFMFNSSHITSLILIPSEFSENFTCVSGAKLRDQSEVLLSVSIRENHVPTISVVIN